MTLESYLNYVMIAIASIVVLILLYKLILYLYLESDVYYKKQDEWLKYNFARCNTIVFGKKGTGKDLLFAHVIWLRNDFHYANMPYDEMTEVIKLKQLCLLDEKDIDADSGADEDTALANKLGLKGPPINSYVDIVNGTVTKVEPTFASGKDIYISDGGIYLGCQYNNELNKLFPSMPVRFALSRQLDQNNIHINVQYLGRVWDKLREQADSYIWIRINREYDKYFILEAICYEKYDSAIANLLPDKGRSFVAKHGDVVSRFFKIYKKELTYDTHYFKRVFYKSNYVENELERSLKNV